MVRYRSSSGRRTWYMVQGKQRSANVQVGCMRCNKICYLGNREFVLLLLYVAAVCPVNEGGPCQSALCVWLFLANIQRHQLTRAHAKSTTEVTHFCRGAPSAAHP